MCSHALRAVRRGAHRDGRAPEARRKGGGPDRRPRLARPHRRVRLGADRARAAHPGRDPAHGGDERAHPAGRLRVPARGGGGAPDGRGEVTGTVLVVRPDNAGDVLLAGPAVRAVAAGARRVVLLAGPYGRAAAELLPGVDEVLEWRTPWIDPGRVPVTEAHAARLITAVRRIAPDQALIFTSFHQSALPMALLLRLAGTPRIAAISADYPGTLLDVRHVVDETVDVPEPERMLGLARAAGFHLPDGDDRRPARVRGRPPGGERPGPDLAARAVGRGGRRARAGGGAGGGHRRPGGARAHPSGRRGRRRRPRRPHHAPRARRRPRLRLGGGRAQHRGRAPRGRRRHPGGQPVRPGGAGRPLGAVPGARRDPGRPGGAVPGEPGADLPDPRPPLPLLGPCRTDRRGGPP